MTSRGLRGHLTRMLHWEFNVRDLDRSVAFYESLAPFRATETVDDGATRSALLAGNVPLPRLRLVEWRAPRTTGDVHDSLGAIGFTRLVVHVADLDATRGLAESLGIEPVAATTGDDFRFELGSRGSVAYRVWSCLDPDGIVVEFLESPVPKLSTVAQGTAALARNLRFYTDLLGLEVVDTVATVRPMPNVYLPDGEPVEFHGVFLRVPGVPNGYLDLLEHCDPRMRRPPYEPTHHVGAIRCAFEVDDLDAAERTLRDAARHGSHTIGEQIRVIDLGRPLGRRRLLDLRDTEGVAYQLVEAAP